MAQPHPSDPYAGWNAADRAASVRFEVSGARQLLDADGKKMPGLFAPEALRLVCLRENIAVDFAQGVYKKENVILSIQEVPAPPQTGYGLRPTYPKKHSVGPFGLIQK